MTSKIKLALRAFMLLAFLSMIPGTKAQDCSYAGLPWSEKYSKQQTYMPFSELNSSPEFIKTIKVSIHIWRNDEGTGIFPNVNSSTNNDRFAAIIESINDINLINLIQPSDPIYSQNYYSQFTDTKIRLNLTNIYYHNNSTIHYMYCNAASGAQISATATQNGYLPFHTVYPEEYYSAKETFMIHITGSNCLPENTIGIATTPQYGVDINSPQSQFVISAGVGNFNTLNLSIQAVWTNTFLHELAHCLGLSHNFSQFIQNSIVQHNCQAAEILDTEHPDFLNDLFPDSPQSDCILPNPCGTNYDICFYEPASTGCDPFTSSTDDCNNNVMSKSNPAFPRSFSPLQLGRMHRFLTTGNAAKFTWGYDPQPYSIEQDETWNFPIKMYQDIHVRPGNTLTIQCAVELVKEARIIVYPNARLVVDGGVLRAATYQKEPWQGVEVWGAPTAPLVVDSQDEALFADHGVIELRNGALIENALVGIRLGSSLGENRGGGVVRCFSSVNDEIDLRNCQTGIKFDPYPFPNGSNLQFMRFSWDGQALAMNVGGSLVHHLFTDRVRDLDIRACTFANTQPGITTSTALGQGITSINSTLTVRPGCPNGADDCPGETLVRNSFTNLDHGIELFDTGTGSYATIHQSDFTNNIAGIYANGMTGFAVTENLFTVGDNGVELVGEVDDEFENKHRALFSTESYGFIIRDNILVQASTGVAQPLVGTEGIVVGYTRDHNDVVLRNSASGLERAFVGEGISADVSNSYTGRIVGLQFHCNESDHNAVNFLSRRVASAFSAEQIQHSIRYFQGDRRPADNRFDRWPVSTPDRWDFNVDTETPLDYFYREPITSGQQPFEPLSFTTVPPRLLPNALPNLVGSICNDRPTYNLDQLANMDPDGLMEDLEEELQGAKLAYGNVRFIHQQLVDGGDHDEVVHEISSTWPNEAWQLRQYLLDLSPFLSTESLKNAVNKPYFPMAMKAEVCIANPDATKKEGFTKWLLTEALEPMPEYLVQLIEQSWDTRTFRTDMELELAEHHATLSYMANEMRYVELRQAQPSAAVVRGTWQQVRTTAARYAEANVWLGEGNYSAAYNVVSSIPQEHDLRSPEQLERLRMMDYITLLQNAANAGRAAHELTTAEVNQLKALSDGQYDRAANWISNLLCVYYEHCRPPRTGGEVGGAKSQRTRSNGAADQMADEITIAPNPTQTWATVTYTLTKEATDGLIEVKDATGRPVLSERLAGKQGQVVLDTRLLAKGAYTVQCRADGVVLVTERLIVQ
jgi:hypothetical protein